MRAHVCMYVCVCFRRCVHVKEIMKIWRRRILEKFGRPYVGFGRYRIRGKGVVQKLGKRVGRLMFMAPKVNKL